MKSVFSVGAVLCAAGMSLALGTVAAGDTVYEKQIGLKVEAWVWIFSDSLGCPDQEAASSKAWQSCQGFCGSTFTMYGAGDGDTANPADSDSTSAGVMTAECFPGYIGARSRTNPPCAVGIESDPQIYVGLDAGFRAKFFKDGTKCFKGLAAGADGTIDLDRPAQSWAVMINVDAFNRSDVGSGPESGQVRWIINVDLGLGSVEAGGLITPESNRAFGLPETSPGSGNYFAFLESTSSIGEFAGKVKSYAVQDRSVDFNGDGRFNAADVATLTPLIGFSWPSGQNEFDLDNDGTVDQDEVDYLQDALDAGLDAGIFGDLDGDGDVDCDDLTAQPSDAVDAEFGETDYRIQLDKNLDGIVVADEVRDFYKLIGYPDYDLSGFLDFFDAMDYDTAFENDEPGADWNGDGFLDFFDYNAFIADFESPQC